ncbi:efflux transporter outer membrane subunit [Variovorax terrae]|uniref:Efflux transporter outer membrane subunit n=1 Tax=Variovorax terrae TaxID=2923278 RepID=A0A9X1VTV3_9BURK|nr:efflux transporter outer membrane subunit [Variovorax terrae]MCJ0761924.1 efflux transporter outer membrane subunit [Variovorax terrae]
MTPPDARFQRSPARPARWLAGPALAALLAGCAAVGPDYVRPAMELPAAYKESGPWKTAQPQPIDSQRRWWEAYGDSTLNALIEQANQANQNIRQAEAQYRQARALADAARAGFSPTLGVNAGADRSLTNTNGIVLGNDYSLGLGASWEPDLWGSVRRAVEAGQAGAQASADDLAAARLSIQAALAQDYLQLRVTDLLLDLYAATTAAYTRALQLTQSQYAAGVALRSDVALAETQLKTAQAQGVDLQAQRSQLEHAIAILTGRAPADFTLPPAALTADQLRASLPAIPAGLPSDLLERRPDIAGAERRVAAANANIGVARAAFYPSLTLGASDGFNMTRLATLFNTPSRVWSLGASLAQTLFDGGLRQARSAQAVAAYDVSVAQYKQIVLGGLQQVEDNLALLRTLDHETGLQDQAVQAAQLAERLTLSQYRAGTTSYLAVVTAQTLSLSNQRTAVQLQGRQLAASVALVTALGGGWHDGTNTASREPARATPPASTLAATRPES